MFGKCSWTIWAFNPSDSPQKTYSRSRFFLSKICCFLLYIKFLNDFPINFGKRKALLSYQLTLSPVFYSLRLPYTLPHGNSLPFEIRIEVTFYLKDRLHHLEEYFISAIQCFYLFLSAKKNFNKIRNLKPRVEGESRGEGNCFSGPCACIGSPYCKRCSSVQ